MHLVIFALLISSRLPGQATAGVATHEVVQLGDQSLVTVDTKNGTLDNDSPKAVLEGEVVVDEIMLDDEDDEEYYDEEDEDVDYDDEEENEQSSEAYSTSVSAPAVHIADEIGSDLGTPQIIDSVIGDYVKARISDARIYIRDTVMQLPEYEPVRNLCVNKHENCAFWAEKGECDNNAAYMHLHCAPVCFVCEMLHVETRCPMPEDDSLDAFKPGDLDKMFERILADPYYQEFEPKALSRPTLAPGDTLESADYKVGGPWVGNASSTLCVESPITRTKLILLFSKDGDIRKCCDSRRGRPSYRVGRHGRIRTLGRCGDEEGRWLLHVGPEFRQNFDERMV